MVLRIVLQVHSHILGQPCSCTDNQQRSLQCSIHHAIYVLPNSITQKYILHAAHVPGRFNAIADSLALLTRSFEA